MQRTSLVIVGLLSIVCIMAWHVLSASGQATEGRWVTLFDGTHLDHWQSIGDANWRLEDGVVVADKGSGFLVSKEAYADFQLRVEFWVDEDAHSGIFIRCTLPDQIGTDSGYEVNIYDKRPDPSYGTGAIVNVAKVEPMPKAGGRWNVYEITAQGPTFTVTLNGHTTVDGVQDTEFGSGRIALQYGASVVKDKGVVKFRKIEIKPLG